MRTLVLQDSISGLGGEGWGGRSGKFSLDHDERRLKSKLPTAVPSVKESMSFSMGAGGGQSGCRSCHSVNANWAWSVWVKMLRRGALVDWGEWR